MRGDPSRVSPDAVCDGGLVSNGEDVSSRLRACERVLRYLMDACQHGADHASKHPDEIQEMHVASAKEIQAKVEDLRQFIDAEGAYRDWMESQAR